MGDLHKGIFHVALILLIIGGLNWGLIGFMGYNFVEAFLGIGSVISQTVYDLVGIAAVYALVYKVMCLVKK